MPVSCSIYRTPDGSVDSSDLVSYLQGYSHTKSEEAINGELLTDTTEVEGTERGVRAVVRFDEPLHVGARPEEPSYVKNTIHATIRFVDDLMSPGFIFIGPKSKRNKTVREVAEILDVFPNDCDLQEISSLQITQIVGDDSQEATFGWWRDIDAYTSSASIQGDIEDSTHAQTINNQGRPVWVIFDSRRFGKKVGVATDSVAFYGNGWDEEEMEDYLFEVVLDHIT